MSESLRKKLVFASLPLAIVWAVFNYPSKKTQSHPQTPEVIVTAPVQAVITTASGATKPLPAIDIETRRKEPWGDDPFRSTIRFSSYGSRESEPTAISWALAGIIYSEKDPIAFVNNRMVGIGDKVNSATVVAIDRETVTLEYEGRTISLKVRKG